MSYSTVNALMKGIADAIRAKDGTSAAIPHQNFPDRIAAIQGGISIKDVLERNYGTTQIELTGPWSQSDVKIFGSMFDSCTTLTDFSLTGATVSVLDRAFYGCTNLRNLNIDPSDVHDYAFYNTGLQGDFSFPNLDHVGLMAFGACSGITSINAPLLDTIDESGFDMCQNLATVNFPSVYEIGRRGLAQTGITEITLPNCSIIHESAFFSCASLRKIVLAKNSVCTLENTNAFMYSEIMRGRGEIRVPASLVSAYKSATNWSSFSSQILAIPEE